jgi:hemolysin III
MLQLRKGIILDEVLNSVTHGVGIVLVVLGIVWVFWQHNDGTVKHTIGISIFSLCLFLTYLFSTLFHSLSFTKAHRVFATLDHASIFLLIVGTYTPLLLFISTWWVWILLGIVWIACISGIVLKAIFFHSLQKQMVIIYLLLGWLAILIVQPLYAKLSSQAFILLVIGGLCYTLGTPFYARERQRFFHPLWHMFVLAGSIFHYFVILSLH